MSIPATQRMQVIGSRVASMGFLREKYKSFAETAFRTAGFVAAFIPLGVGAAIGYGLDRMANRTAAKSEKKALAEWYAPQVAKQLGIDPSRVTTSDLELAATVNPAIAKAVRHVEQQQSSANTVSGTAAVVGAAASMIPIPGTGALANGVVQGAAKLVTHGAVTMASAATAGWLTAPDVLKNPQTIAENLEAMREQGAQIAPIHTFMLRVAQNEGLQAAIKEKMGAEYHSLSAEQQALLIGHFPRVAAFAKKDASFLARGGAVQELMFIQPEGRNWTGRVTAADAAVVGRQ